MRVSKYTVRCIRCGKELVLYPRHIQHHEPIPCGNCRRLNSADEYDLSAELAKEAEALRRLIDPGEE